MQRFHEVAKQVITNLDRQRHLRLEQTSGQLAPKEAAVCVHCQDRGYLRANVPFGHPQFGKAIACECTKARKRETYRQQLWVQSKIDQLVTFQQESFETFQFWHLGVQDAYNAAVAFTNEPQGWLVLQGPNGCGKTHLAVSIAKQCLENGHIVLLAVMPDLLDHLRSTFSPDTQGDYDEEFAKMREAEVLILDDLGAQRSSPWADEKLFQLLNSRYNAHLATVVATNCIDLVGIDPRVRSRLQDRRLVRTIVMNAQDFRDLDA
jgi:DNA replication protein DnaC